MSRGIGRAIAEELQSRGAAVVGAARNVADVPATASLLAVAVDVTQETGRQALLQVALARHGRIDGLVNNVGTAFRRASVDTALEDFRQVLEVNLLATFALCCAAHPVRGGTSKGVFIMMNEYPKDPAKRDAVILAIYGSPDVRQIDGLGGADVLTSKHAIISPSTRPNEPMSWATPPKPSAI